MGRIKNEIIIFFITCLSIWWISPNRVMAKNILYCEHHLLGPTLHKMFPFSPDRPITLFKASGEKDIGTNFLSPYPISMASPSLIWITVVNPFWMGGKVEGHVCSGKVVPGIGVGMRFVERICREIRIIPPNVGPLHCNCPRVFLEVKLNEFHAFITQQIKLQIPTDIYILVPFRYKSLTSVGGTTGIFRMVSNKAWRVKLVWPEEVYMKKNGWNRLRISSREDLARRMKFPLPPAPWACPYIGL